MAKMQGDEMMQVTARLADYTLVLGVVTFLAVVVALFGEQFWRWLRKPKLKVSYDFQKGAVTSNNVSREAYFVRLYVHNSGHTSARNVQVVLHSVKPFDSHNWADEQFIPMYLSWLYHECNPWLEHIPPRTGAYCNLAQILRPDEQTDPEIEFVTMKTPLGIPNKWGLGRYEVQVQVAGENAIVNPDPMEIACPKWSGDKTQMQKAVLGSTK